MCTKTKRQEWLGLFCWAISHLGLELRGMMLEGWIGDR